MAMETYYFYFPFPANKTFTTEKIFQEVVPRTANKNMIFNYSTIPSSSNLMSFNNFFKEATVPCSNKQDDFEITGEKQDRISELPNDIRINILSLLTVKESVLTGVLSRSWVDLWKHTTRLDFDDSEELKNTPLSQLHRARHGFIKGLKRVIELHQSSTVEHLRIRFDFPVYGLSPNNYDDWLVNFAISRKVRILELDFSNTNPDRKFQSPRPFLCDRFLKFDSLRVLSLTNISGGGCIEQFLFKCPSLEHLTADGMCLWELRIIGPSLRLKYLKIGSSCSIGHVEISNVPSLETLIYDKQVERIHLKDVYSLANLMLGGAHSGFTLNYISVSCCFSNLEILEITTDSRSYENISKIGFPELSNLKKLSLKNPERRVAKSLVGYTYLVERSPNLKKFVLQGCPTYDGKDQRKSRRMRAKFPHKKLELVELGGYIGENSDLDLVRYFVENTLSLQKIIIDLWASRCKPMTEKEYTMILKDHKQQLKRKIPDHIQLQFARQPRMMT